MATWTTQARNTDATWSKDARATDSSWASVSRSDVTLAAKYGTAAFDNTNYDVLSPVIGANWTAQTRN